MSATWHKCFLCEVEYLAEGDGRWGYCPECEKTRKEQSKIHLTELETETKQEG